MIINSDSRFWVVRDPSEHSVFEDIFFEANIQTLGYFMAGTISIGKTPISENLTIHTIELSARQDAEARLKARE